MAICTTTTFYYPTVKYVEIQDTRLVLLRYVLLIGIAIYVIVFELWAMGGWLDPSPIVGVVRFSLQQPTINNCNPSSSSSSHVGEEECYNNFVPLNTLPYCKQYYDYYQSYHRHHQQQHDNNNNNNNTDYPGNVYPCEFYEAINAELIQEKSLTVITRASTIQQKFICPSSVGAGAVTTSTSTSTSANDKKKNNNNNNSDTTTTCPKTYENLSPEYKFYTAQSESFTILIDHAVTASKICTTRQSRHSNDQLVQHYSCSAEASSYPGRLYSHNDHLCYQEYQKQNSFIDYRTGSQQTSHAPCYINPNRTSSLSTPSQDFFSLDILLQAANIRLDDCNHYNNNNITTNNNTEDENNKEHETQQGNSSSSSSFSSSSRRSSSTSSSTTSSCQTYRDTGATLLLNIYWNDFVPYHGRVGPYYYMKPQLIAKSSFKQYIPFYENHYRDHRTLVNAHGIRIAILLGGEFNSFNIVTFLITLTTALGLLAIATTIVDSLMLYVLPEKEKYQQVKYEHAHPTTTTTNNNNEEMIVHHPVTTTNTSIMVDGVSSMLVVTPGTVMAGVNQLPVVVPNHQNNNDTISSNNNHINITPRGRTNNNDDMAAAAITGTGDGVIVDDANALSTGPTPAISGEHHLLLVANDTEEGNLTDPLLLASSSSS